MKVTLIYVSTLNGLVTRNNNPDVTRWTSADDQKHFSAIKKRFPIIITSSSTYKIIKPTLKPVLHPKRIVLTRNPQKYANDHIPQKLEFTSDSPQRIISKLQNRGVTQVLLATGPTLTTKFLQKKLVDEFILTLEPKLFGTGKSMINPSNLNINLKLKSINRLNPQGTLVLTYALVYK